MGAAFSALIAGECHRVLGNELTGIEAKLQGGLAREATDSELNDWAKFKVFQPSKGRASCKSVVDTRWASTWEVADSEKDARACLVSENFWCPELGDGIVDTLGVSVFVSLASGSFPWALWKNWLFGERASRTAACRMMASVVMYRIAHLWNWVPMAPTVFGKCRRRRVTGMMHRRRLTGPCCGILSTPESSLARVGLKCRMSSFDLR